MAPKATVSPSISRIPKATWWSSRVLPTARLLLTEYSEQEPKREEVEALQGATLLEFGSPWCGWCRRAQPLIAEALQGKSVRHIKVADASGRRLGRSFDVKLWPTLVFLRDGKEQGRLVRPATVDEIKKALDNIDTQ